ncbi:MAG: flagellar hook assembly protein FlgD [Aquificota bacterium]|nr:flagellar hook assembly protein FlgD [Aquificota bacterium]
MSHLETRYDITPPQPKVVGPDYVQSFDNLSAEDFMKIYLETLRLQDPFRQNDISKAIEDTVRLNQIKFFTDMKKFIDSLTAWLNQMTFLQAVNLIGKDFVFRTDTIDTVKGGEYYILSGERVGGVTIRVYDGDEVIKEIRTDLKRGLNPVDLSDLPKGQFTVRVFKGDLEITTGWDLGFKDTVKATGIVNGDLMLELLSGRQVPASQIIYSGG